MLQNGEALANRQARIRTAVCRLYDRAYRGHQNHAMGCHACVHTAVMCPACAQGGNTPLSIAAEAGSLEIVQMLAEVKGGEAALMQKDKDGDTPLLLAGVCSVSLLYVSTCAVS